MSATLFRFPGVRIGVAPPRALTYPLTPLGQFMAELARLSASNPVWWDDFGNAPFYAGWTASEYAACLLPCSGCVAAPCGRCHCAPRWFNHRRQKEWRRLDVLDRAIIAALTELRAETLLCEEPR